MFYLTTTDLKNKNFDKNLTLKKKRLDKVKNSKVKQAKYIILSFTKAIKLKLKVAYSLDKTNLYYNKKHNNCINISFTFNLS